MLWGVIAVGVIGAAYWSFEAPGDVADRVLVWVLVLAAAIWVRHVKRIEDRITQIIRGQAQDLARARHAEMNREYEARMAELLRDGNEGGG